jgi:hypothetical protein
VRICAFCTILCENVRNALKKDRYLTIRLPHELEMQLRKLADEDMRSLVNQILLYLTKGLESDPRSKRKS